MEIEGAAVATMLSNLIAMLYFIALILKKRKILHITFDPRCYTLGRHIPTEVLLIGYNYSAKNFKRMRPAIKLTLILCLSMTLVAAALLFTCAAPL